MIYDELIAKRLGYDTFPELCESMSDFVKWVQCPVVNIRLDAAEGAAELYFRRSDIERRAKARFGDEDIARVRAGLHPEIVKTDDEIRMVLLMAPGFTPEYPTYVEAWLDETP